ncbi:circularly permuted type 2 ATP-grasp protein [Microlunatus panaciterrae]|uniref:Circularly permuted ATP-grasp superfamily protein/putative alpha-E superfamily protein n=1 Tax=Microlunatus panaciterrae TaxID=400768 RepID=A0ABS2RM80_9ACTN|nr:circularly permuted type 2 ATP-grasp protein [Microlunatus panaciterrae]MBM7799788.1 putative circularly permuted ATP-grasp superfamily protein/putative alpha-E superfamily protein [Microlunatus panaciterrae]
MNLLADGSPGAGWQDLLEGIRDLGAEDLGRVRREVARLLEDDGVSYTPSPPLTVAATGASAAEPPLTEPTAWRLDPVPLVLDEWEWATLEVGLVQRAELLNAVLADLYGERRLIADGLLPPAVVFGHREYLRSSVGIDHLGPQLILAAADLGRDAGGEWRVLGDRTQAPSGAGYAMENRRVISRALPELYGRAHLHRLTPFFQSMRAALADAAAGQVEDPRVVVLSPGTHSETAFDQAFLASLLGFPLLEGNDLTVRDGKVWMRGLGKLERVDVILRRVDAAWSDPLELRPNSQLGVPGLLECVRQGSVTLANGLGAGVVENPALLPFLPEICQRLLGEPLRLPSVETFWCGDRTARSHVLASLDSLVIRPISRADGRSVIGASLTRAERERLADRIEATPYAFVGQRQLSLSPPPSADDDRLEPRSVVLRSFAVRRGASYAAMPGGMATSRERTLDDSGGADGATEGSWTARDVWVVGGRRPAPSAPSGLPERAQLHVAEAPAAMVPRVLSDLFWFGRYAERAEDLLRLILATRQVAVETDGDRTTGQPLDALLRAVTHVSAAYPGYTEQTDAWLTELRSMVLDRRRTGTVAQSVAALTNAAQGVRDQLSQDVWMVLAGVDRALAALTVAPYDQGPQLYDTSERLLSGLLALTGITSENMVRDPGWYLLDSGRGIERGLQVLALLRSTVCRPHADSAERMVIEAALSAAESIVTYRRRYRGQTRVAPMLELLVLDRHNPRAVAYQVDRVAADLRSLPGSSGTSRPVRLVSDLAERLAGASPTELVAAGDAGGYDQLASFLGELQEQLRRLAEAIAEEYLTQPPQPQPLWRPLLTDSRLTVRVEPTP